MRIGRPNNAGSVVARSPLDGTTSGSTEAGTSNSASNCESHCKVLILNNKVRDALLASVTWRLPPVRFQISQLSIVPNASSPLSARERAPGTLSSSHCNLVPEK